MSIHLDDHAELLQELPHGAQEVLRGAWQEAARALSARGLDNYLKGALALHHLGRGEEVVVSFLQQMPALARAIGEDVLPDLVNFLLSMASKTSGQVLTLMAQTAPTAALRLGDAELFRQYLSVLGLVLAQAPQGLRPMLENLERLLAQLTLGGLRRWVQWGAQAYRADVDGQRRYFGLQSADALAVLQQERRGTLFVDVQRRLNLYLRALWGRDFFLRPTAGDFESREGLRPYIERHVIHIADAYDDVPGTEPDGGPVPALEVYRAAANHCAAHLMFARAPLSDEGLDALTKAVVELVEDARVETLACRRFPRLRQQWRALHPLPVDPPTRAGDLINRLALAWLDEAAAERDPDPWVREGVAALAAWTDWDDPQASLETGRRLAESLRARIAAEGWPAFSARLDGQRAIYRDDNRAIWVSGTYDETEALIATWERQQQVRRKVNVIEMVNEVDVEFAGDDAQEVWILPTEFWLDQEGVTINSLLGRPPLADPVHYPEWDYQIQLLRPDWVTVLERHAAAGDPARIEALLAEQRPVVQRLRHLIEAMAPQGVQRIRKLEDGDELDLDAAVRAWIDWRSGQQPDTRIMMQHRIHTRDVAVLLLLDLSASANDPVRGTDQTVLDLTRAAAALMAEALQRIGDRFAIHGFRSDGRHDVHYLRVKDFRQGWGEAAKARLAGLEGAFSTRLGAALRHAGAELKRQPQRKRIVFVLTDGEPADVDVRDPQYLRVDAQHAVQELRCDGIISYCLTLDPRADAYVERIFGARHYTVLERVQRLPEVLPSLYLGLTR
ncbi:VWA domain-containing protein [Tepidimonas taiwanensis]|uniref:von Willebrand factor type A domain protein n=1 Tax=Tepidimonas taiwanensis TaxID=307486 RepID=A0A554X4C6_9BURK|nr:VWA domain-containing protein [Tepidimonas taiwanensis]TSE30701.1 von Willebrand factor type A domain protein [Tepidimonas taiwanensis]UBQ06001.1 VWA domain-containing protein [Tepidimonas taiwanensis]